MGLNRSPYDWRADWRERWGWQVLKRVGVEFWWSWGGHVAMAEMWRGDEEDPRLWRWLRLREDGGKSWVVRAPYKWMGMDNRTRMKWVEVEDVVRGKRWVFWFPKGAPWELVEVWRCWCRELESGPLVDQPKETGDGHEESRREVRFVRGVGSHSGEGCTEEGGELREGSEGEGGELEVEEPLFESERSW